MSRRRRRYHYSNLTTVLVVVAAIVGFAVSLNVKMTAQAKKHHRHKKQPTTPEPADPRVTHRDPNFHTGRWGRYGTISSGADWLHRDMSLGHRYAKDPDRAEKKDAYERERRRWELPDGKTLDPKDPYGKHFPKKYHHHHLDGDGGLLDPILQEWMVLSPLTHSGVPPVVVHIPMRPEEQQQHQQEMDRQERARTENGGAQTSDTPERDLAAIGHRLPDEYLARVKRIADEAGFQYMGMAAPTVMPEHHVFHADLESIRAIFHVLWTNQSATAFANTKHQDRVEMETKALHRHTRAFVPPKSHHNHSWMPPVASEEQPHWTAEAWHAQAAKYTRSMAEPGMEIEDDDDESHSDASQTTNPESIRAWQRRFEKAMRERAVKNKQVKNWKATWKDWAMGIEKESELRKHRVEIIKILYGTLVLDTGGQVMSVEVQRAQPRVLRVHGFPRQPTMWQSYRERWDAPSGDDRPARALRGDPRRQGVKDPMLVEEWNVYDANAWGDLPPGPHTIRPSIEAGPPVWDLLGFDGDGVGIGVIDSGIELGHPELVRRYARATSLDALHPHSNRPPTPEDPWVETHGTQAAGVALAERGNGICGAGVAPGARLGAVRLLGQRSPTDAEEAMAISHACRAHGTHPSRNALINHIFSCSWGPMDDGSDLRGPGPLASRALNECVHKDGRLGRGSIYVWAGGNGRTAEDNTNFDGYANRPETIAVAAMDDAGKQAWYSEPGACLMVAAPSSGGSSGIVTSDPSGPAGLSTGACSRNFGGTSAAAPAVAGVVALILQSAPDLGWRDVQHILVRSSSRVLVHERREPWTRNEAGHWHSHGYGFGLLNATHAALLSSTWNPMRPKDALVYTTDILEATATWDQADRERDEIPDPPSAPQPPPHERKALDTAGYHPETRVHTWATRLHSEPLAGEPTPGDDGLTVPERNAAHTESAFKSIVFFPTRFLAHKTRQVLKTLQDAANRTRSERFEAQRALAANRVRQVSHNGHDGIAVPLGQSVHFEWEYPFDREPSAESKDRPERLEHVGLRLDADLPSGRGLLRIWLCSPSGTCSLMAQAPRSSDRHTHIDGDKWTFWTVRHWDEAPRNSEDRTGHGPGTWSLRLKYTWPTNAQRAHRMRDLRVRHPFEVDALIRWWQLEFRGSALPRV